MSSRGPIPYLSYRDAAAAIDFLEKAFGFRRVTVFEGYDGVVAHAEMRCGEGFIMLGTATDVTTASAAGVYFVVDDVDAHHATALAAGAEVVEAPMETPFGTRRWRAKDPEGYEWSFGDVRAKLILKVENPIGGGAIVR